MTRKTKGKADKIDKHVAGRLRLRRSLMGLSMQALGEKLNLSGQQIQKYETGKNRITAGRLFELGVALGVPTAYFYEGLYANDSLETALQELSELPTAFFEDNFFIQPENFELLGNYHHIKHIELKKDLQKLLKTLSCLSKND